MVAALEKGGWDMVPSGAACKPQGGVETPGGFVVLSRWIFSNFKDKRSAEEELYFRSLLVDPGANVKKENVATETEDTLAVVS